MLRTAIIRGLRPTTLLLNKQPFSKWSDLDRLLLQAYQIYEDEISKNSGLPFWLTRNIDPEIILTVEERDDIADKLLADWDEKNSGKKGKRGTTRYVVARDAEGNLLEYGGLTRQRFREAAIQEQQDRDELGEEAEIERDRPPTGYDPAEYGDGVTTPA